MNSSVKEGGYTLFRGFSFCVSIFSPPKASRMPSTGCTRLFDGSTTFRACNTHDFISFVYLVTLQGTNVVVLVGFFRNVVKSIVHVRSFRYIFY